jgi:hypothetical protein
MEDTGCLMAKHRKQKRPLNTRRDHDGTPRQQPRTSVVLLKSGLVFSGLAGLSVVALVQFRHRNPPGIELLWSGLAALTFLVAAVLCLLYSFAFWADKRWHVFSRWVWPRGGDLLARRFTGQSPPS